MSRMNVLVITIANDPQWGIRACGGHLCERCPWGQLDDGQHGHRQDMLREGQQQVHQASCRQ